MNALARHYPPRGANNEQIALARLTERLSKQFPEISQEQIEQLVRGRHAEFEGRPVRDFVPILVERGVRAQLRTGWLPDTH